jgi:hypothetical protein
MRKALVFVAAFALVLVAGAAVAFMATPGDDVASESEPVEKTTTTVVEKESPVTTEKVDKVETENEAPKEVKAASTDKEDPPKDEDEMKEEVEEKDTTAPKIEILFPANGQHFEERTLAFEGKVDDPAARVFAGKYEADVDGEGNWRIVLKLTHDGANHATFKAVDEAGNESTASVKAYYDAPEAEEKPKEEEPKSHEFSAHQKYGSCGEDLPYDKWYGTGEPGTEIWIGSEYGSATTEIGKSGEWYLKVKFPESPCNDTFQVVLETNKGHRKVYEFTRICDEEGGDHADK